ncbi:ABC transporter permease [Konateibacter massiliensis]|uniref:ABC transporter permease n=1 Tax=Konateibacter massiliensis TaxID=2002841 RepID=UPI000C146473|nr:ABC transporter permease [Konateibacter massiliensis]
MRKFMEGFTRNVTKKQIGLTIVAAVSFLVFIILQIVSVCLVNSLAPQQAAERWDSTGKSAQISSFISDDTTVTPKQLVDVEHGIEAALTEVSITAENENARLWIDAYSARGELTVESAQTSITATAIGVGGDFFFFHPLKLVSGSYFSDEDLMKDYIILDEDAAWQLFGSNDIEGMQVTINGMPHIVRGVIERGEGRMNDKAGNGKVTFYVSYDSLNKYAAVEGINTYEVVMPNPISEFALSTVKEKLGLEEDSVQLVENSKRYSMLPLLTVLSEFGVRSMNQKAIIYPYWENVARGYEDIVAFLLLWKIIFLLIPLTLLVIYVIFRYRHRTWNMRTILDKLEGLKEKLIEKYQNRKKGVEKKTFHVTRRKFKNLTKKER